MSLKRKFIRFVLPSMASMLVFNLYTMVDGIFIANYAGETALAGDALYQLYVCFFIAAVDRRVDVDFDPSRRGARGAGQPAVYNEHGCPFHAGIAYFGELRHLG